jgi:hypothetical protein
MMPVLFFWSTRERQYALANNQKEHASYGVVIKRNPWLFAIHCLVFLIAVVGVIWGFWTSLESLIDNIKGNDDVPCLTDADCDEGFFCPEGEADADRFCTVIDPPEPLI